MNNVSKVALLFISAAVLVAVSCGSKAKKGLLVVNDTYSFDTAAPTTDFIVINHKIVNNTNNSWLPDTAYSDCICLATFYGTEAVVPGDTLFIKTQLFSKYEEGDFNKVITIKTGLEGEQAEVKLYVKGFVDVTKASLVDRYPFSNGTLLFKSKVFDFGQVLQGKVASAESEVYNNGDSDVTFKAINGLPDYIRFDFFPRTIKPGESATIKANYSAQVNPAIGEKTLAMDIITADDAMPMIPISTRVDVMEDFSLLSEDELANAPKAEFDTTVFNYGTITEGDVVKYTFNVTNTGKRNLLIRKIETGCGCTVASPANGIIKPGESTTINAVFDSKNKSGNIRIHVRVITNNPNKPYTELLIDGVVEPKDDK